MGPEYLSNPYFFRTPERLSRHQVDAVDTSDQQHEHADGTQDEEELHAAVLAYLLFQVRAQVNID